MTRNPLRQREFATVWSAGLISDTGDWLLIIALPLYVFSITSSALSTSTLFLAERGYGSQSSSTRPAIC